MLRNYLKLASRSCCGGSSSPSSACSAISFTLLVLMVATAMLDHVFAPQRARDAAATAPWASTDCRCRGRERASAALAGYGFLDRYVRRPARRSRRCRSSSTAPRRPSPTSAASKIESVPQAHRRRVLADPRLQFLEGGPFTAEDEANARFVAVINETTRAALLRRRARGRQDDRGRRPALPRRRRGARRADPARRALRRHLGADQHRQVRRLQAASCWATSWRSSWPASRADFPRSRRSSQARLPGRATARPQDVQDARRRRRDALRGRLAAMLFERRPQDGQPGGCCAALLAALALLFMLLPAVNLVNLNLSRILERASEIGVRKAFGASSRTLVGQFVVENLVLTLLGGAARPRPRRRGARGAQRQRRSSPTPQLAPQLPRLPLRPGLRRLLRALSGRLPGLADVAAPPGRGSAREVPMIRHLLEAGLEPQALQRPAHPRDLLLLPGGVRWSARWRVYFWDNYRRPLGFS